MKLNDITSFIEGFAPLEWQENYDNSGLIVGHPQQEVSKALVSLDCTEAVLEEAIATGCDLIISHHPIVFTGMKLFNEASYIERVISKAIRNNVALYAAHTNLDNIKQGVNATIMSRLGVENPIILYPKSGVLKKLAVYVPKADAAKLRDALFNAGAGNIGKYSECSFNTEGFGTFVPDAAANPTIGEPGGREEVQERSEEHTS